MFSEGTTNSLKVLQVIHCEDHGYNNAVFRMDDLRKDLSITQFSKERDQMFVAVNEIKNCAETKAIQVATNRKLEGELAVPVVLRDHQLCGYRDGRRIEQVEFSEVV